MKSSTKKERRQQIRTTRQPLLPMQRVSRKSALHKAKALLSVSPSHPEAHRLIDLFDIQAEELAEAGVGYEVLKVVESLHPLMRLPLHGLG